MDVVKRIRQPLPVGEGWGEGRLFHAVLRMHKPRLRVGRQGVSRAPLQSAEDAISNVLGLTPQLVVPKSKLFDAE